MIKRFNYGFTLIEVLISLALGSLVLGVVLSDVSSSIVRLARVEPDYRAMLVASSAVERAAAKHLTSAEVDTINGSSYTIAVQTVAADSRVMELKAVVPSEQGRQVSLSIYRLRMASAAE